MNKHFIIIKKRKIIKNKKKKYIIIYYIVHILYIMRIYIYIKTIIIATRTKLKIHSKLYK